MVEMYYQLVLAHKRTCDENNKNVPIVPNTLRPAVLALLIGNGYDKNGNIVA
jgi:hypothetical protein